MYQSKGGGGGSFMIWKHREIVLYVYIWYKMYIYYICMFKGGGKSSALWLVTFIEREKKEKEGEREREKERERERFVWNDCWDNTVSEKNIGPPKMQNYFGAIKLWFLNYWLFSISFAFFSFNFANISLLLLD